MLPFTSGQASVVDAKPAPEFLARALLLYRPSRSDPMNPTPRNANVFLLFMATTAVIPVLAGLLG